jgi:hypothetical protein
VKVDGGRGLCRADVIEGDRVVIFLDKAGGVEGGLEGALTIDPTDPSSWGVEIEKWNKATDDTATPDVGKASLSIASFPKVGVHPRGRVGARRRAGLV